MTFPGFAPALPLPSRSRAPSRCIRRNAPIRAVISREPITGETELPVHVDALLESDVSNSSIQTCDDIDEILALAEEFDLRDLRIVDHGVEVEITRAGGHGFEDGKLLRPEVASVGDAAQEQIVEGELEEEEMVMEQPVVEDVEQETVEEKDPNMVYESDFVVKSNRVGFFFSGAKGKPPLVNVGDKVAFNQPVCIIEQLGQQYVYLSEASGVVMQMFVEDGDAVEYAQQVMVIRPD